MLPEFLEPGNFPEYETERNDALSQEVWIKIIFNRPHQAFKREKVKKEKLTEKFSDFIFFLFYLCVSDFIFVS